MSADQQKGQGGKYLNREPAKEELMHVYVNYDAESPTQLTQEAIRCCQNLQIDYRELLPFSKDSLRNKELNSNRDINQQLDLVMRQYEQKR